MFGIRSYKRPKSADKITDNFYHIHEMPNLDCNIYLLVGKNGENSEIALIDAGNALNSHNLVDGISNLGLDPKKITKLIITHEHLDHILGIYNLPEIINPDVEIIALGETARTIREGDEETIAPRQLGIKASRFGANIRPLSVTEVKTDDTIEFGDFRFKVYFTPGHSRGSMSLYDPSKKILFPGDVVFCGGSFGRVDFPGGSGSKLKESINKLADLDITYLCPGHMRMSKNGSAEIKKSKRMINSYFR